MLHIPRPILLTLTGFAVLAVYLAAMAPGVFWRDSMECCFIGHQLDIGHPAGSPAYSLLAKALSFLPLGSLAWRANLLCVLGAWAAAILMWFAVARWLAFLRLAEPPDAGLLAAAAALAFAFSESLWAWSATAKVYSLRAAALAGLLWLAAEALDGGLDDPRWAATIGLLLGVAAGVHIVFVLYAPAFGVALIFGPRWRVRWRGGALMLLFFFVGFSVYAYLPARALHGLPYDQGNPQTWPAFVAHITGRQYAHIIHRFPWARILHHLRLAAGWTFREINPLLAAAAVAGAIAVARRSPRALALIVLVALGHLYLYIKDWATAFGYITIYQLTAVLGGLGLAALWRPAARRLAPSAAAPALALVAAAMGVWGAAGHGSACCRNEHDLAQRHGAGVLDSLPLNAILVGYWDWTAHNVFFQQLIERQRPDVQFLPRVWLLFPDELARRLPAWDLRGYDPATPFAAQKMLLANDKGGGVYWDLGMEEQPLVEPADLTPHGAVFRLGAAPWDGRETADDRRLWRDVFGPILASPLVAPRGYDWTAADVYAHILQARAELHALGGRWEAAERDAAAAIAAEPDFAEFRAFLGKLYLAQNRLPEAAEKTAEAVRLDPYCAHCWAIEAQVARRRQDPAGAIDDYLAARRLQSLEAADAVDLAGLLFAGRRIDEMFQIIAETERNPLDAAAQGAFDELAARAYAARGQCPQALARLTRLQAAHPESGTIAAVQQACGAPGENHIKSAPDEPH